MQRRARKENKKSENPELFGLGVFMLQMLVSVEAADGPPSVEKVEDHGDAPALVEAPVNAVRLVHVSVRLGVSRRVPAHCLQ